MGISLRYSKEPYQNLRGYSMDKKDLENFFMNLIYIDTLQDALHQAKQYKPQSESVKSLITNYEETIKGENDKSDLVLDRIEMIEDNLYKKILFDRFILNKEQLEIARDVGYSYTYFSRIMKKAITEFEKLGD